MGLAGVFEAGSRGREKTVRGGLHLIGKKKRLCGEPTCKVCQPRKFRYHAMEAHAGVPWGIKGIKRKVHQWNGSNGHQPFKACLGRALA